MIASEGATSKKKKKSHGRGTSHFGISAKTVHASPDDEEEEEEEDDDDDDEEDSALQPQNTSVRATGKVASSDPVDAALHARLDAMEKRQKVRDALVDIAESAL